MTGKNRAKERNDFKDFWEKVFKQNGAHVKEKVSNITLDMKWKNKVININMLGRNNPKFLCKNHTPPSSFSLQISIGH